MKLNIFTDLEDLPPQIPYEPILLSSSIEKINTTTYYHRVFEEYLKKGSLFLQESSLEEADLVILPINWEKALTANVVDLQYSCRKIWEKWISPEGFFANLYRHFSQL